LGQVSAEAGRQAKEKVQGIITKQEHLIICKLLQVAMSHEESPKFQPIYHFIHLLFLENPPLIRIVIEDRFDIRLVPFFIDHIPSSRNIGNSTYFLKAYRCFGRIYFGLVAWLRGKQGKLDILFTSIQQCLSQISVSQDL